MPPRGPNAPSNGTQAKIRRLKATIVGDVVGYSRLIEADDVGTVERLSVVRRELIQPLIERFNGSMTWSAGDHMVALFDSVVDAVECACRIQATLEDANADLDESSKIRMRIGVNFGDVIIEGDEVAGDSVNIAARIEGLCDPGGLAISEAAYGAVLHKIPLNYEDEGVRRLKNIAEPVRIYRVHPSDIGSRSSGANGARSFRPWRIVRRRRWSLAALASLVLLAGAVTLLDKDAARSIIGLFAGPDETAIAVLPFENLSEDVGQDHIARGIATDLIIELSGIEQASIIARSSSFRFAERPVDLKRLSELLGARYVVDGTVLRNRDNIRVNILLIDTLSERQIWADRFEGKTSELFKFQRDIAAKVLKALLIKFAQIDRPTRRQPSEFAVTDVYYQAREAYYKNAPDQLATSLRLFKQILETDPDFRDAHAYLAAIYWAGFDKEWAESFGLSFQDSLELAWQHLGQSLEAPLPLTYEVQARMFAWERDYEAALTSAEKAIQLAPNDPVGRLTKAIILIYAGQTEAAFPYLERASTADPLNLVEYLFWEGMAQYLIGDYQAAEETLRQSIAVSPDYEWSHLVLAAALGQQGETADARTVIEAAQDLRKKAGVPAYSLRQVRYWTFQNDSDRLKLCEGLAKAGLAGRCE